MKNQDGIKTGLYLSFYILVVFLSLRKDFGTDYNAYFELYSKVSQLNFTELFTTSDMEIRRIELGWIILNYIFSPLSFNYLIAFVTIISLLVYFSLIQKYGIKKYYWLSILILIFNFNIILIGTSALRQAAAITCFIYSVPLLFENKRIKFVLCVFLASTFHLTAIHLLLLLLLKHFKGNMNYITKLIFLSVFVSLFLFRNFYSEIFSSIITYIFDVRYSLELFKSEKSFNTFNFLIYLSVLILLLHYYNRQKEDIRKLFLISIFGLYFFPMDLIIPLFGRLGYYYIPFSIITYTYIVNSFNRKSNKSIFIISLIIVFSIRLYGIYFSDSYNKAFNKYNTIFNKTI